MKAKLIARLNRVSSRYLIAGVSIYLFELLVILVAQAAGASPVKAVAWSFILGTALSFGLQKFVTFGDKRLHHKVVLSQLLAVSTLVLFNFGFTVLVAKIVTHVVPAVVSRTLALGITTIWNFYLYKTRVFKSHGNPVF